MKPRLEHPFPIFGLLSAASLGSTGDNAGALRAVAGRPLIVRQIATLQSCGIDHFLIEVDSVPGELLQWVDGLRKRGAHIDFVRSVADLEQLLPDNARLAMIAEAHYLEPSVLQSTLDAAPAIATVDSRDDNARFERIDLNTRWAGFAVFDAKIALSMDALPDGWSLTSSLLRHAIRCGVPFQPMKQSLLQEGHVLHVESEAGPQSMVRRQLSAYAAKVQGVIERHVFAPVAVLIAPKIWPLQNGQTAFGILPPLFAAAALAAGFLATPVATAALALTAMAAAVISGAVGSIDNVDRTSTYGRWATLALIGGAMMAAAWSASDYGGAGPAFAVLIIGTLLIGNRVDVSKGMQLLLRSPALVALLLLFGATAFGLTAALQWTALLLTTMLVIALYWPKSAENFTEQP